jgi:L-ribulose-5-phosphate 3-epimerase UlaE
MPKICRDIPFGQGIVDFDQVFAEIKHIGFKGLLLLEMWANSHSDPIEEMAKAYSFITSKIQLARP